MLLAGIDPGSVLLTGIDPGSVLKDPGSIPGSSKNDLATYSRQNHHKRVEILSKLSL